jgi:hypothetical protein
MIVTYDRQNVFIVQATTWCVFEKLSSKCSSKSSENNMMQNVY